MLLLGKWIMIPSSLQGALSDMHRCANKSWIKACMDKQLVHVDTYNTQHFGRVQLRQGHFRWTPINHLFLRHYGNISSGYQCMNQVLCCRYLFIYSFTVSQIFCTSILIYTKSWSHPPLADSDFTASQRGVTGESLQLLGTSDWKVIDKERHSVL